MADVEGAGGVGGDEFDEEGAAAGGVAAVVDALPEGGLDDGETGAAAEGDVDEARAGDFCFFDEVGGTPGGEDAVGEGARGGRRFVWRG